MSQISPLRKVVIHTRPNVAVIDPESLREHVHSADSEPTILSATELLTFPGVLPGFEVVVGKLFE